MKQPHISPGSSPVDTHSNKPILSPSKKATYMVADSCSRKGELLGLCPSNLYKTNRNLQNIPMEDWIPMECLGNTRKRPLWTGRALGERPRLSGAPSIFKGKYLDSALEGAKLMKKHRQEEKNHREEHNNALKIHQQAVLHVQKEKKGCYQLKGDQRIFRLDIGNIFYPRPPWLCLCWVPGDAVEPPCLAVLGWAEAEHEQHTELSHPGALLSLLQVSPTSALSQIKQEECIITFSQISVDVVNPPPSSAFLCSCTAPLLEASFVSTKPKIAACSCQNQHSKPHSQNTKSIQSILQKFWQKKLSASLSTLREEGQEIWGFFSIYQYILIFENLICPKPKRRVTILNP